MERVRAGVTAMRGIPEARRPSPCRRVFPPRPARRAGPVPRGALYFERAATDAGRAAFDHPRACAESALKGDGSREGRRCLKDVALLEWCGAARNV
jgi:hypothetical protein